MILKGRVVDSVIAKHLPRKQLNELRQKYSRYYSSINPDIVTTEYVFPKIDNIIWH